LEPLLLLLPSGAGVCDGSDDLEYESRDGEGVSWFSSCSSLMVWGSASVVGGGRGVDVMVGLFIVCSKKVESKICSPMM
jgi:hypothetical protein